MERDIRFVSRKYDWGWSLWIKVNGSKVLLADKLKSEEDVQRIINSLPDKENDVTQYQIFTIQNSNTLVPTLNPFYTKREAENAALKLNQPYKVKAISSKDIQ